MADEQRENGISEATCDELAWLRNAVRTAIQMGILLDREATVQADREMFELGVDGVAKGCVREVVRILGKRTPVEEATAWEKKRPGWVLSPRKDRSIQGPSTESE